LGQTLKSSLSLEVSDLACSRGERRLFTALAFSLASGETMLVTGPNGAGKTTLIRTIAGFLRPDAGAARLDDAEGEVELASSVHYLGHRDGLKAALTVRENLALAPVLMGGSGLTAGAAAERLRLVPLLDLAVAVLSAGQRRRVALARLLMVRRPLWLLDEPTAALDASSSEIVAGLILEHAADGGMTLAATHLPLGLRARGLALDAAGGFALRGAA
jgi:heme exporter protein A